MNGMKDCIWSLDKASKIKISLWKFVSEAIPVVDNLIDRSMKTDIRCQICDLEGESLMEQKQR